MSDGEKRMNGAEEDHSDSDGPAPQNFNNNGNTQGQRTMQRVRRQDQQPQQPNYGMQQQQQMVPVEERISGNMGGRTGAIRESRIKDRPIPQDSRDSSLKIKIELDLEVEVDLYARVKGDVTIGLM